MKTDLYRAFSGDGELLYVGISHDSLLRLRTHIRDSQWADVFTRLEVERFSTRDAALAAERTAIASEHPKFNTRYNGFIETQLSERHPPVVSRQNNLPCRLLRIGDVEKIIGITGVKRLASNGQFPRPVMIGRFPLWVSDEVYDWIEIKMAARDAAAGQQ
jgi:predicted DNA-binding transcriptional regulator AlpA